MTEQENTEEQLSGAKPVVAQWRKSLNWLSRIAFSLLLIFAVLMAGGRLMMPLVSSQRAQLEAQLGNLLGTRVSIAELKGDWFRFGPILEVRDLNIISDFVTAPHVISRFSIKPALLDSILARSLVIDDIVVHEPSFILRENPNGSWSLEGLQAGDVDYTDAIIDFLLTTGRMQITEAHLVLHWLNGRELTLDNVYVDLSNRENRHLTQIQARIAGQQSPFQLLLEINGDPRQRFTASAYLQASQLELHEYIELPGIALDSARLSGDFWLGVQENMEFTLQSSLESVNLYGSGTADSSINTIALDISDLELTLDHGSDEHWQAWLSNAEIDWQNRPWHSGQLYLDYESALDNKPLAITANSLDLAMVNDIINDLLVLPERAAGAFADLSPQGSLSNILFTTELGTDKEADFFLTANLQDVAVGAWQGAPAASGVYGYLEADRNRGFVELDSSAFSIHLPRLFVDPWNYDEANSRVHWSLLNDMIRVNSSIIDVRNESTHGHVQFDLLNYRDAEGDPTTELTLLIGVLEMDASDKSLYLPTLPNLKGTMDWLDDALLGGDIRDSGFVSRTLISRNPVINSGTVLSFYQIDNGVLKFQPDWPELTDISAFVTVNNNDADVMADKAMIQNMLLSETMAQVRPDPSGGSWLTFSSSSNTTTDLGLEFLKNTPVRNNIGAFIEDWQGQGSLQVDIELGIPINNPGRENDVLVNVLSNQSTLSIPEYSLSIDELRGRVVYDSESGLSANAMSGKLFDFPIAATIESMMTTNEEGVNEFVGTRIVGSGRASKSALEAWQGQPDFVQHVLGFADGEIDYLAEITIPSASQINNGTDRNRIRLTSELLGLSLELPYPFTKTVENIRPMELLIEFTDDSEWVSVKFDNKVGANIRITDNEFTGGKVVFGPAAREMTFGVVPLVESGLVFSGLVDIFNYDDWEITADRFSEMSFEPDEEHDSLDQYISLVDVQAGRLLISGQTLENVHTRVSRINQANNGNTNADSESGFSDAADSWLVQLENELLGGDFIFPDERQKPWNINLSYLRLPEAEEPEDESLEVEEIDIMADINPATLPDMDFHTDEFSVGEKQLGAWDFLMRTDGAAATISELKMTTPDAKIRDLGGEEGANLDWRYDNGMHTTSFNGVFSAGDLAQVLPGWGYDANVESDSAAFVSNLQWTGSPAAFGLEKVVGTVQVDIRNGRFVDIDSGGSRLFGAFSFDSLVRRLQLDFSDLYRRGLAYDAIRGGLQFDRGIVTTQGAFRIEGPSSRITIDGEINLHSQTIDADMLVNVPLGQNLSVLAGILGAWPIAVSTYIAGKIFQDQVDDFTTVLYRLEGPWEDPSSGFEPTQEILRAVPLEDDTQTVVPDTEEPEILPAP